MPNPKAVVRQFNAEVIQGGDRAAFERLVAPAFINHSAPPGAPQDREGLWQTFEQVLRPALAELRVEVLAQVAEGDWVTTRKRIHGVHRAALLGVPASGRALSIDVIDMVRIQDGRYLEHWGMNSLAALLAHLRADA